MQRDIREILKLWPAVRPKPHLLKPLLKDVPFSLFNLTRKFLHHDDVFLYVGHNPYVVSMLIGLSPDALVFSVNSLNCREDFLHWSWDYRHKLIPLHGVVGDALGQLEAFDLVPNLVIVDPHRPTKDIMKIREKHPKCTVIGYGDAVPVLVEPGYQLVTEGDSWVYVSCVTSSKKFDS